MYKLLDAMVIVIIVVGVSFGMWYVDGLHQQRSLQLHELSSSKTKTNGSGRTPARGEGSSGPRTNETRTTE
jgi:hypothetical protein